MLNKTRDTIFIGEKPFMTNVIFTIIQLITMITIRTKGFSIGHAVDVVRIVLRKTNSAFIPRNIKIGSESLVSVDENNRDVSTIEISIKRTKVWGSLHGNFQTKF